MARHHREQFIFLVLVLLLFLWAGWDSLDFPDKAQTYPRTVAFAAAFIAVVELIAYGISMRSQTSGASEVSTLGTQFVKILPYLIWILAFYATIYVIGIIAASGLFVCLFLIREGNVPWYYAIGAGIVVIFFLITIEDVMSLKWPRSLIDPLELLGFG
ncbi:MAG: tripartite tricarboxylate transporter TctB family protein [Chloroflexota bacterium]